MTRIINRISSRQIRGSDFSETLIDLCNYSDFRVVVPTDFAMKYISVRVLWVPRHG